MKKLILLLVLTGCASNLTEAERVDREYARQDRHNQKLEKYYQMVRTCQSQIWIKNPSRQYQRTGVPTWEDLVSVTCGQPPWIF